MKTTAQFLDALRVKLDLPSDGRLAAYLGLHRQYISRYRNNTITFDDETSIQIAELLEIDPAYVTACMHYQRAKAPKVKAMWERMAVSMTALAATLLIVLALPYVHTGNGLEMVGMAQEKGNEMYIMSNCVI